MNFEGRAADVNFEGRAADVNFEGRGWEWRGCCRRRGRY